MSQSFSSASLTRSTLGLSSLGSARTPSSESLHRSIATSSPYATTSRGESGKKRLNTVSFPRIFRCLLAPLNRFEAPLKLNLKTGNESNEFGKNNGSVAAIITVIIQSLLNIVVVIPVVVR